MTATTNLIRTLIADLADAGVELSAYGGRLRLRPKDKLTPDLLNRAKAHKLDLIKALSIEHCPSGDTGDGDETPRPDSANKGIGTVATVTAPKLAIEVPRGWTGPAWAVELRRKADRCERLHPDIAATYRRDAEALTPPATKPDFWLWDIITEDQKQCRTNAK